MIPPSRTCRSMFVLGLTFALFFGCAGTMTARELAPPPAAMGQKWHGNRQSRIYHNPSCRYYNCKSCTVVLSSRREARERGFRPCKVCGG